ncbi:MAG: YmfQ family protein [Oscillospiraceae bacterium]|jgi:hypothetical protein|nr:YmfQ family protein [Oscillospiraceae bacterium]
MNRRLFDYLPPVLQKAPENRVLLDAAEQPETGALWEAAQALWAEQFIDSATDYGLSRWERMMRIPSAGDENARRQAILVRLRETPPFTLRLLLTALGELCGPGKFELSLAYNRYTLTVRVTPRSPMGEVRALLSRWLPANILLDLDYLYLSHNKARAYRHEQLAAFTHKTVREMTD